MRYNGKWGLEVGRLFNFGELFSFPNNLGGNSSTTVLVVALLIRNVGDIGVDVPIKETPEHNMVALIT